MQPAHGTSIPHELVNAARARLAHVEAEMSELSEQRSRIDSAVARLADESSHLDALLATYEPGSRSTVVMMPRAVRLKTLADQVVDLLVERDEPMHYRDIERELRRRGAFSGTGRDPANALLATYYNDDRLFRPSRGTYAIKPVGGSAASVGQRKSPMARAGERRKRA